MENKSSIKSLLSAADGQLIVDRTDGARVVSAGICHAVTFLNRMQGLLFTSELKDGLVIHRCNSVHMMFMKYAIDVVFADKDGKILRCVSNLKPWRISPVVRNAYFAVELPEGTIKRVGVDVGERLVIADR